MTQVNIKRLQAVVDGKVVPWDVFMSDVKDAIASLTRKDASEGVEDTLSWIVGQATDGMYTAAGCATSEGDPSGVLQMLHSQLSDIAINAETALAALKEGATREG